MPLPVLLCILGASFLMQSSQAGPPKGNAQAPPVKSQTSTSDAKAPKSENPADKLLGVRRIYVERFGDDSISKQIQAVIIDQLNESKRFVVTEDKDRADAILRGSGLEKTSQELHAHSEGTAVATAAGSHSSSVNGSVVGGTGSISGSSSGGFAAQSAAVEDANVSTETTNDARVSVRLVARDGDVIWTTSQESRNAKYKSSTTDVAEKVVKKLLRDIGKLESRIVGKPDK